MSLGSFVSFMNFMSFFLPSKLGGGASREQIVRQYGFNPMKTLGWLSDVGTQRTDNRAERVDSASSSPPLSILPVVST